MQNQIEKQDPPKVGDCLYDFSQLSGTTEIYLNQQVVTSVDMDNQTFTADIYYLGHVVPGSKTGSMEFDCIGYSYFRTIGEARKSFLAEQEKIITKLRSDLKSAELIHWKADTLEYIHPDKKSNGESLNMIEQVRNWVTLKPDLTIYSFEENSLIQWESLAGLRYRLDMSGVLQTTFDVDNGPDFDTNTVYNSIRVESFDDFQRAFSSLDSKGWIDDPSDYECEDGSLREDDDEFLELMEQALKENN